MVVAGTVKVLKKIVIRTTKASYLLCAKLSHRKMNMQKELEMVIRGINEDVVQHIRKQQATSDVAGAKIR